jgi:uncharacterized protein (DUF2147 family)
MMRVLTACAAMLAVMFVASLVYGADADSILGSWNTADKDAKIEIYQCGPEYCGRISYLKEPNYSSKDKGGMAGLPRVDRRNPDPHLRIRPLLGLRLIEGFHYAGDNTWEGGRIYNPDDGRKYKAKITLSKGNRLLLRGFVGISLLGRTETWTR